MPKYLYDWKYSFKIKILDKEKPWKTVNRIKSAARSKGIKVIATIKRKYIYIKTNV